MKKSIQHNQTKGLQELFRLPVLQVSPYFNIGRGAISITKMSKVRVVGINGNGALLQAWNNSGVPVGIYDEMCVVQQSSVTPDAILTDIYNGANVALQNDTGLTFSQSDYNFIFPQTLPVVASSYQTIVSQTGTAAPAVSGSLSPASTYPSGTTFTWARTGAGVYTLTASTAVFNTSGKTGVFVGSLNNLNASCKTVVTNSTVITITTAIGSLLGLGLLGLTATNTDALLSQTMIYVQTYV